MGQTGTGATPWRCSKYSPVGVKHWHGAAPDSWFSHLAVEVPGDEPSNEWLEAVDNTAYFRATEWLEHLEISEK